MARTKLIVSGIPGVPSRVEPLTPAEEAEHDKLDAIHPKLVTFHQEANTRIAAMVPGWDVNMALRNDGLGLADTPEKKRAVRTAKFASREARKKLRVKTVAEINAIDPASPDPFGDGVNWPR